MATVNATVSGATTYKHSLYRSQAGILLELMQESTTVPFNFTPAPGTNTYTLVTEGNNGSCMSVSGEYELTCSGCDLSISEVNYICNQDGTYNISFLVIGGSGNFTFNGIPYLFGRIYRKSNLPSGINSITILDTTTSCTLTVPLSKICTQGCNFTTNDNGLFAVTKVMDYTATAGAVVFDIALNSVGVPDRLIVVKNGIPSFDSGCIGSTNGCFNNSNCTQLLPDNQIQAKGYTFSVSNGERIEIYVDSTCSQNYSTCWGFKALCQNNQVPFTVGSGCVNNDTVISNFQPITLSPLTKSFPVFFTNVTQQAIGLQRIIKFNNSNAPSVGRIPEYGIVYENVQSAALPTQWGFVYGEYGVTPSARIRTLPNNNDGIATPGAFTGFTLWVRDYLDPTTIYSQHYTFI